MDWEKIKSLVFKYKLYLVVGFIMLIIFVWAISKDNSRKENLSNFSSEKQELTRKTDPNDIKMSHTDSTNEKRTQKNLEPKDVTCDISGAIKNQGVYTLKNGARLNELIEIAGGLATNAQLKNVNRALILKDQDKIYIPHVGEKFSKTDIVSSEEENSTTSADISNAQSNSPKININTADSAELQKLNGIGEKKAQQIISYRQKNGQFKQIEDLKQVSGIGDKTFETLKSQLEI